MSPLAPGREPVDNRGVSEVRVCASDALVAGEVQTVALAPDGRGRPREALILRDAGGTARAYLNRCRHLPIPIDCGSRDFYDESKTRLICVTHGATYRLDDGVCDWGPCKNDALEALPLVEREGVLYVVDAPALAVASR